MAILLELRLLTGFSSQRSISNRRAAWWLTLRNRRTVFNRTNHWRFIHVIDVCHRGKTLLAAHSVDQALLTAAENGVGKNGKIAKHPKQINSLEERWHYIARPDRRLHLHYACRDFVDQHLLGPPRNLN